MWVPQIECEPRAMRQELDPQLLITSLDSLEVLVCLYITLYHFISW